MHVIELRDGFGIDKLTLAERPEPVPGPGQVLLKMRAACLNYRDLLMVQGHYNARQPLPLIPLSDGVGEVEACGPGVDTLSPGVRVCPIFAQGWLDGKPQRTTGRYTLGGPLDGTLCQKMLVDARSVVPLPAFLSDVEAATLPCAAVTAWNALVDQGGLTAGQTVLIQGSGGVAVFALQFAKLLGARIIATSSSDAKLERLRALGAAETINYRSQPDWGERVRKLGGADLVVEVGGAGTLSQSLRAVQPGGCIALIGVLSGVAQPLNILPILMAGVRVQGIFVGSRATFVRMLRAIEHHRLRPVIDSIHAFADAPQALESLAKSQHFGKICLRH